MFNKLAKVLTTTFLITQPSMADVVYPVDYPFNPTSEKLPIYLTLSKKTQQKFEAASPTHIYKVITNSRDWEKLDKELRSKVLKNKKNFAQVDFEIYSLYWDKENGIHILAAGLERPTIHFQRTMLNRPEDMAFELQRTAAINKKTNRPYFELTPQFLRTLEKQTNNKLTTEQRDWLTDYASVLNENFHFFYGERFFWFHDVIKEVNKRNLMGRYFPRKFFLRAEQELFIPSIKQETNFLYLKLINTLPQKEQANILKSLIDLPSDNQERINLLNDTERLLTEPGMKKHSKQVTLLIKALKREDLDTKQRKSLLANLLPIIQQSRFKYDLYSRYIQTTPRTLEKIISLVPANHKTLVEQIRHDLARIDEIYENKMKIGTVIGRPVYNLDKVFANRQCTLLNSLCHGATDTRVTLPANGTITVTSPDAGDAGITMLNARSSQLGNIGPSFIEMIKDIDFLAKEHDVCLDDIHKNKTAFTLAMAHLSCQAINACYQVLESDYACNFLYKENIELIMSKSGKHGIDIGKERSLAEAIQLQPYDPTQIDGVRFIKSELFQRKN